MRVVSVVFTNSSEQDFKGKIQTRIYQASSATVMAVNEVSWKTLHVLPQQTVSESATLQIPAVKAKTRFLVQWLDDSNHLLGRTEVLVYPTNLLAELKHLAGDDQPVGVFDPGNQLKPLLKSARVEFYDLEQSGIADFCGRLAILGPFETRQLMPRDLTDRIRKLAARSTGVVWIQPPPGLRDELKPSFYNVPSGTNAVMIVQANLVADLSQQPLAQQRLVTLCRQALNPEPMILPTSHLNPNE